MPPNLDVYVISPARDRKTIARFLDLYVDRPASEDRGGEELMILRLDASGRPLPGHDEGDWDWEPSKSLTHIVQRGLEFPHRAFSTYLRPLDTSLAGAVLAFDADDHVIFGASLDDEGAQPENLERAKRLLHEIAEMSAATRGFIAVEEPPPLRGRSEPPPRILVYSWAHA
jgi:hypothetical protein